MAKLLHIQASPMCDRSFSIRAARAFIGGYRETHLHDDVETLDLWKSDLPAFDYTAASGKYKVMHGEPHGDDEARAWKRVADACERFKAADRYLVSSPMWNFGIPYRLKQYIDIIVQPGLTFSFDPEKGYSGLVTGKPLQLILARGGEYKAGSGAGALDLQRPYLELIFGFVGFTDIRTLVVEPTMVGGPAAAERKLQEAMASARGAGRSF